MPIVDITETATRLSTLVEAVPDGALGSPTPCSEYSVGDLLDHVAGVTVAFGGAAVKSRGPSADLGPQGSAANLDSDWRVSVPARVAALARAWQDPDAWTGTTRLGGQDLPGEVAGIVTFGELTVHGWDLARATGIAFTPDEAGVTPLFELVRATMAEGGSPRGTAFGPPIPVPDDAPVFDRVLGLLGRDPNWAPRRG